MVGNVVGKCGCYRSSNSVDIALAFGVVDKDLKRRRHDCAVSGGNICVFD